MCVWGEGVMGCVEGWYGGSAVQGTKISGHHGHDHWPSDDDPPPYRSD